MSIMSKTQKEKSGSGRTIMHSYITSIYEAETFEKRKNDTVRK